MQRTAAGQERLFPDVAAEFPSTRYQGSKAKLVDWIWDQIADLDFATCLDAFGGTGAVAYRLKQAGKEVAYNDLLRFNYFFGLGLIENSGVRLSLDEVDWLLQQHQDIGYPHFVRDTFPQVYFTDVENAWIDQMITNLRQLTDPYKFALGFFALSQACLIKRPYNLFHRRNLYLRFAEVDRSFGNKVSWDRPFEAWFRAFAEEANRAVFDNGQRNRALNLNALDVPGQYDLVYVDTPYVSERGTGVDYLSFYHFLEGLTMYEEWGEHIDWSSRHHCLKRRRSEWTDKNRIHAAFDRLFDRYRESTLVVSYRSDGIPSESELASLMKRHKRDVRVVRFGRYRYALSTNSECKEILLIGA